MVVTEVSLKGLRFYVKPYPNPIQTYKARRMQYEISGALCQGTFWNTFLVYLIFFRFVGDLDLYLLLVSE